ncbi:hypothetical protein GHV20_016670 [Klebsiella oxytoca]
MRWPSTPSRIRKITASARPVSPPVMAGTLPARVTSTKSSDIYGHIDRDGRYRVSLLFDRDHWPPGEESLWVRRAPVCR